MTSGRNFATAHNLPAAIVSIQTAGKFLNWHPHLHVLAPAGAIRTDGVFVHSPVFAAAVLRDLFQANVLTLLLKERMISQELVERMREWRHSGFHAYAGEEIPDIIALRLRDRLTQSLTINTGKVK